MHSSSGGCAPTKACHTAIRVARSAGIPLHIAAKMREKDEFAYSPSGSSPCWAATSSTSVRSVGRARQHSLADALCLLNPIAWPEPFGMVMIEALACGTPVVATPCGSVNEIVRDGITGFLRSDVDSLATAVGHAAGLDRHACRSDVIQRFSAARMADEHVDSTPWASHQRIRAA